jgi:hypothetical protein
MQKLSNACLVATPSVNIQDETDNDDRVVSA